jgi:hypothetical protein
VERRWSNIHIHQALVLTEFGAFLPPSEDGFAAKRYKGASSFLLCLLSGGRQNRVHVLSFGDLCRSRLWHWLRPNILLSVYSGASSRLQLGQKAQIHFRVIAALWTARISAIARVSPACLFFLHFQPAPRRRSFRAYESPRELPFSHQLRPTIDSVNFPEFVSSMR